MDEREEIYYKIIEDKAIRIAEMINKVFNTLRSNFKDDALLIGQYYKAADLVFQLNGLKPKEN